ncbi:MAG: hypothetical protein O2931_15955, partial [Planctomycetota bacterium]|nr:hypothetical protein [Planctomycetota bacterium]
IRGMVETLNKTIEQSLSVQSYRWRWEAWKTGKSFGEIVLLHTLVYRVDQVFLIHRKTGLLLHHLSMHPSTTVDPEMVSGMLTAIQDFVQDSFGGKTGDTLQSLNVGDRLVLIEAGPMAVLSCVVQGYPPPSLSTLMCDQLDAVHRDLRRMLDEFQGDSGPLAAADHYLSACLLEQYQAPPKKRSRWVPLLTATVPLILLGLATMWGWHAYRQRSIWNQLVHEIDAQPGVVVTRITSARNHFFVHGMRDPLAADPQELVNQQRLLDGNKIHLIWSSYTSLESEIVQRRLTELIRPPTGVEVQINEGVVTFSGTATRAWIESTAPTYATLPGVRQVDVSKLVDSNLAVTHFLDQLRIEPGYLVTHSQILGDQLHVYGLRDPLSRTLEQIDPATPVPQVVWHGESYTAHHDKFILARARRLLSPAPSIELTFQQGILRVVGSAAHTWIQRAQAISTLVPGIEQIDLSQCSDIDREVFLRDKLALESIAIYFQPGGAELDGDQLDKFDELNRLIAQLLKSTQSLRLRIEIDAIGFSAPTDSLVEEEVHKLRQSRGERVVEELTSKGIPRQIFAAKGSPSKILPNLPPKDINAEEVRRARRAVLQLRTW